MRKRETKNMSVPRGEKYKILLVVLCKDIQYVSYKYTGWSKKKTGVFFLITYFVLHVNR